MIKALSINWEITRQCNLRCTYCRVNGGLAEKHELTKKDILKIIDELKKNNFRHLKFTGGEPLVRKDFWEIVEYAHKKGLLVSLISNGMLIDDRMINKFKKYISIVAISLDSVDSLTNQKLGRGDSNIVTENIRKLVKNGLHVKILSTITKINKDQIDELLKTAKKLGAEEIKMNDIVLNGRAECNSLNLGLEKPLVRDAEEIEKLVVNNLKIKPKLSKMFKCECNQDNLYIDFQGDLYPCVEMFYTAKSFCLGNLIRNRLENLLEINRKFYRQINSHDYCAYSYMTAEGFSACLNRSHCPKSLAVYMANAKS